MTEQELISQAQEEVDSMTLEELRESVHKLRFAKAKAAAKQRKKQKAAKEKVKYKAKLEEQRLREAIGEEAFQDFLAETKQQAEWEVSGRL